MVNIILRRILHNVNLVDWINEPNGSERRKEACIRIDELLDILLEIQPKTDEYIRNIRFYVDISDQACFEVTKIGAAEYMGFVRFSHYIRELFREEK